MRAKLLVVPKKWLIKDQRGGEERREAICNNEAHLQRASKCTEMVKKEEPRLSDPAHAIGRVIATQDQPFNANGLLQFSMKTPQVRFCNSLFGNVY